MSDRTAKFGSIYFGIFGAIVLIFGIAGFVVIGVHGTEGIIWGPLEMSGMFLVWEAIILVAAGAMYLSSVGNFGDVRQVAKSLAASIMIWIVAGMAIWAMFAGSIPGGEEGPWFNPPSDFADCYAPPYTPAMFLLPFSLAIIYPIRSRRRAEAREEAKNPDGTSTLQF
ncbi:MAG: hypothetical protein JW732_06930 [Dehalococcoidia bacterium]|nr:hypothetical protein [Dehalococcoidia bacterium]